MTPSIREKGLKSCGLRPLEHIWGEISLGAAGAFFSFLCDPIFRVFLAFLLFLSVFTLTLFSAFSLTLVKLIVA